MITIHLHSALWREKGCAIVNIWTIFEIVVSDSIEVLKGKAGRNGGVLGSTKYTIHDIISRDKRLLHSRTLCSGADVCVCVRHGQALLLATQMTAILWAQRSAFSKLSFLPHATRAATDGGAAMMCKELHLNRSLLCCAGLLCASNE